MQTQIAKGDRKGVTQWLCDRIQEIEQGPINAKLMKDQLDSLSDAEFSALMDDYYDKKDQPTIYAPNNGPVKLDAKHNIQLGRKWGHEFWQSLEIGSDDPDTPTYTTPPKYLVFDLMYRRQAQVGILGISVPTHHNTTDHRTGAVTGDSAAAKLSGAEANLYQAMGMVKSMQELLNVRGGDDGSRRAMETEISRSGGASLATIERYSTGVGVTNAMRSMLMAMHLNNTL